MTGVPVVRAERLTKFYGPQRGVLELDFAVEAGEVFGFLGPNGAGKTTTIRLLLDLIRPTAAGSSVFGLDPRRDASRSAAGIGYLPGDLRLYERLTGARAARATSRICAACAAWAAEQLRRAPRARARPADRRALEGNRQKVGLVQAFMHDARPTRPRRADGRARPADPADVLRARRGGTRSRRAPSSSPPTSCPRCSTLRTGSA